MYHADPHAMKLFIYHEPSSIRYRPLTEAHLELIRSAFPDIEIVATEDADRVDAHIETADIIAGYPHKLAEIDLHKASNLKWLHSFSAGVDRIISPELQNTSILLSNSSGIHAKPIAEHVVGFLLVWTKRFLDAFRAQQTHDWQRLDATEIGGKTVFVVGVGRIGSEVARHVKGLDAYVVGVVHNVGAKPPYVDRTITEAELDSALPEADFVCVCLPLTPETRHRFGVAQFAQMKKTAVIINIGRGPIIDEPALIDALKNGAIAGALLDVTDTEPLPKESPLWDMPNVFLTAHYSGLSEKYMDRAIERLMLNLKAYLADEPLPNVVDKMAGF